MKGRLKDKKIRILTHKTKKIPGQGSKKAWHKFKPHELWAYYRELSQAEYYAAALAESYKVDALFVIPYIEGLTNQQTIIFRDKVFDISRIDGFEGNKQDLTIYATYSTLSDSAADLLQQAEQNGY